MEGPLRALVEHLAGPDSAGVLRYACTLLGSNLAQPPLAPCVAVFSP